MSSQNGNHGARISALETGVKAIQNDLHGLRTDLATFASEIRGDLSQRSKTPWGILIAMAGVSITFITAVVGLGAAGPLRDIATLQGTAMRVEDRLDKVTNEDYPRVEAERDLTRIREDIRHLRSDEHPATQERFARVLADIESMDARLRALEDQRPQTARMDARLEQIQRELEQLRAAIAAR